ncbi:hypothetical protein V8G54_022694 [Vigna mungo]|uniref:Uncharacterized protein n=1 Tax=Vigna mungo TaxID=3915 RepID=A0AAQ3N3W8_VIGMU
MSSFSNNCNFASLFLANKDARVSQACFGVLRSLNRCKNSSSAVMENTYIAFPTLSSISFSLLCQLVRLFRHHQHSISLVQAYSILYACSKYHNCRCSTFPLR